MKTKQLKWDVCIILRAQYVPQFGCRWDYCIPLVCHLRRLFRRRHELLQTHRSPVKNHRLLSDSIGKSLRHIQSMVRLVLLVLSWSHTNNIVYVFQYLFFSDISFSYEYQKVLLVTFFCLMYFLNANLPTAVVFLVI